MYFRCLIIFYSYLRSNCVVKNTNADQKVQTSDAHTKLQKVRGSLKLVGTLNLSDFIIQNYTRISFKWDSTGNVFINTKKIIGSFVISCNVANNTTSLMT